MGDAGTQLLYLGMKAQDRRGARKSGEKKGDVDPSERRSLLSGKDDVGLTAHIEYLAGVSSPPRRGCYPVRMKWG